VISTVRGTASGGTSINGMRVSLAHADVFQALKSASAADAAERMKP
jgi:hypothetical protein